MTIHTLECEDEKDYMCKCYYTDNDGAILTQKSGTTRILVKVPVRDVHISIQPNHKQYDRKTDNITLTCKANGDPEPRYTWYKEDKIRQIISLTNIFVIGDVVQNNSGVYICEAYNSINNVYYKHSDSVKIDIVSESPESSQSSAEHVVYAVLTILAVCFILICAILAVRKCPSYRHQVKLKKLIKRSNVVLFMKGDPETPRCGFSKQTIGILSEIGGETQPLAGSPDDYDKGPLESDKDSLEEYADPDPSRFNEDGSFIGQYGAEKMTASDVAAPSAMHTFV